MLKETTDGTRVGLIVPSSNVTMEQEIPALLRARGGSYSFHSSRMRMQRVTPEELRDMDAQAERCVLELADAQCGVFAYACLIAVMVQGPGAHRRVEERLQRTAAATDSPARVISSAGALVDRLAASGARRVAILTPYKPALTQMVVDYLAAEHIDVTSAVSLAVEDNNAVGRLSGETVLNGLDQVDAAGTDALVLSACVQMPTLGVLEEVRRRWPTPVLTAATATADAIEAAISAPALG